MIIRCTQKLLKDLKQKPANGEPVNNLLWSWHGNVFHIERRKCILLTNDETLFSIFIPALKSQDFKIFHIIFGQKLFKTLLAEEIPQDQIETVLSECEKIQYEKTNNRSVLGTMNEQKFQIEYSIQSEGGLAQTNMFELNRFINRNRLSAIDYKYPIEIFKEKLKKITLSNQLI